jgi:hypothetical protein
MAATFKEKLAGPMGRARLCAKHQPQQLSRGCGWSAPQPHSVLAAGNRVAARAALRGFPAETGACFKPASLICGKETSHRAAMSFTEVLAELPTLTVAERQFLIRRALDLDDPALSPEDEAVVEKRLTDHRQNPGSAVPLGEMKTRLRSRFGK